MQWMYHYINMIPRFQCSTTFHFMTMNLWFLLRLWQAKVIAGITHILSHLRERQGKPAAGAAETRLERACDLLGQDTEQRHKGQIRINRHNITWHFHSLFYKLSAVCLLLGLWVSMLAASQLTEGVPCREAFRCQTSKPSSRRSSSVRLGSWL